MIYFYYYLYYTVQYYSIVRSLVWLKGQFNEILDLQFLSSFEPAWATDQWIKIFTILVKISLSYSNFSIN